MKSIGWLDERRDGRGADNFKPGGVDATKPGSIEVRKGQEITSVVVERGSEKVCIANYMHYMLTDYLYMDQPDEAYRFTGQVPPSSELECILIYDEETCVRRACAHCPSVKYRC